MPSHLLDNQGKKYILEKSIGKGITCECFLGREFEYSKRYAIKIFSEKYHEYYNREVSFLSKLKDAPNIIKLFHYGKGMIEYNNQESQIVYYQIVNYAENGELANYINESSRIPEKIVAKLFLKIVKTIKYLHDNNIAHCDIKPENILLDENFNPLLNDFGFSQVFGPDYLLYEFNGTYEYCSNETRLAVTKGFDGPKNDIFSLGVLLFVLAVGKFPFRNKSFSDDTYKCIIKKRYDKFWEHFSDFGVSEELKDLINKLITANPSQRITIDKIFEHSWFKKYFLEKDIIEDYCNQNNHDKEIFDEFHPRKQ